MDFTDFVASAGIKEDPLGGCSFASVDMRNDADVARARHLRREIDLGKFLLSGGARCHFRTKNLPAAPLLPRVQLSSAQHHRLRSLRTKSDKTDCFNRFSRSSKLDLEAIVCECAVRFRHAVRILATLDGGAGVVRRVDQLARELLFHRLAVARSR